MQSATCQICGQVLVSNNIVTTTAAIGNEELRIHQVDLPELDQVAGRMVMHIHERHPEQAREMALVSFAASRVYAMTHTESVDERFKSLRRRWRKTLIEVIQTQRDGADRYRTDAAPTEGTAE